MCPHHVTGFCKQAIAKAYTYKDNQNDDAEFRSRSLYLINWLTSLLSQLLEKIVSYPEKLICFITNVIGLPKNGSR